MPAQELFTTDNIWFAAWVLSRQHHTDQVAGLRYLRTEVHPNGLKGHFLFYFSDACHVGPAWLDAYQTKDVFAKVRPLRNAMKRLLGDQRRCQRNGGGGHE